MISNRSVFFLEKDITPSSINEAERRSSLFNGVYVIKIYYYLIKRTNETRIMYNIYIYMPQKLRQTHL